MASVPFIVGDSHPGKPLQIMVLPAKSQEQV